MSTSRQILSGTAITWLNIAANLLGQILLVPIYLSHWSAATYGIWLALIASTRILTVFSFGYHSYIQGEFLKIGRDDPAASRKLFWTSLVSCAAVAFVEALIIIGILSQLNLKEFLGIASNHEISQHDLLFFLVAFSLMQVSLMTFCGIAVKLLYTYGYYPILALWGVVRTVITLIVPVVVLSLGANFVTVSGFWVGSHALVVFLNCLHLWRLMKRSELCAYECPEWRCGLQTVWSSQAIVFKNALDYMRNGGVRLVMAPMMRSTAVAIFSTNRTIANVMLQGASSMSHPMLPELIHAFNKRDQEKLEALFAFVWMSLLVIVIPALILGQQFLAPLFNYWTQGKIAFEPMLFALFSGAIIFSLAAQPAFAVVSGHNLLRLQILVSIFVGIATLGGMFVLIPVFGLKGAALALLVGELLALFCFNAGCRKWMRKHDLVWPKKSVLIITSAALSGSLFLFLKALSSGPMEWYLLAVGTSVSWVLGYFYFASLPQITRVNSLQCITKFVSRMRGH